MNEGLYMSREGPSMRMLSILDVGLCTKMA